MAAHHEIGELAHHVVPESLVETKRARVDDDAQMNTFGCSRRIRRSAYAMSAEPSPRLRQLAATAIDWI